MGGLQIPLEHVLLLAATLFACGLLGLMLRRNVIFMLMSLEVMLNAAALAFVAAGAHHGQADGQVYRGRGFAHAAFLVGDAYDLCHGAQL